jgi:hypothetical protein
MFYVDNVIVDTPDLADKPKGWVIWSGKTGEFAVSYDRVQSVDGDTVVRTDSGIISVGKNSLDEDHFDPTVRDTLDLAKRAFLRETVPQSGNTRHQLTTSVGLYPNQDGLGAQFKQHSVDARTGAALVETTDIDLRGGLSIGLDGNKIVLGASNAVDNLFETIAVYDSSIVFTKRDSTKTFTIDFVDTYADAGN